MVKFELFELEIFCIETSCKGAAVLKGHTNVRQRMRVLDTGLASVQVLVAFQNKAWDAQLEYEEQAPVFRTHPNPTYE
jgi:hypothetical protein